MRDNFLFLVADVSRVQKGRWCRLALRPVLDLELTRLVLLCVSHFSEIQMQIQVQTQIFANAVVVNLNQTKQFLEHFWTWNWPCCCFFVCSKAVLTTIRNTNTRKILRLVSALELTKSVPLCFKLLYLSVASLNKVNPEVSKLIPSLSKYMILTLLFVIFCEKVLSSQRNNIANIEMVF